jgi:dTDP-4-amino-4,6-dideoxygalactose transaminase
MVPKLPRFEDFRDLLLEIDHSRVYSNFGPMSQRLKEEYGKYLGVSPELIVPLANATLAIQGSIEILDAAEWIIPDYTFAATAHAAVSSRKRIFIADVNIDSFQLELPSNLNYGEFGIVPVMPFGAPIKFENWNQFSSIVFDAAASLGAPPPDFCNMPLNSIVIYSLHATKVLGCGEGSLAVCSSVQIAEKLQSWSNFGFSGSRVSAITGTNAKMSEFSCAVALSALRGLESERLEWGLAASHVGNSQIPSRFNTIVQEYLGFRPYWIVTTKNLSERKRLEELMTTHGVQCRQWWGTPLSEMPAFINLRKLSDTPNSKVLSETHLGLPFWRDIPSANINLIQQIIKSLV